MGVVLGENTEYEHLERPPDPPTNRLRVLEFPDRAEVSILPRAFFRHVVVSLLVGIALVAYWAVWRNHWSVYTGCLVGLCLLCIGAWWSREMLLLSKLLFTGETITLVYELPLFNLTRWRVSIAEVESVLTSDRGGKDIEQMIVGIGGKRLRLGQDLKHQELVWLRTYIEWHLVRTTGDS